MSTQDNAPARTAPVWRTRLIALLAAAAAVAVIAVIGSALGAEMKATNPGQPTIEITPVVAAIAALIAGGLGWLARKVLDRFAPRKAARVWLIGASVVFLLQLFPPLLTEATTGTKITLLLMHVAVAAILVPVLAKPKAPAEPEAAAVAEA